MNTLRRRLAPIALALLTGAACQSSSGGGTATRPGAGAGHPLDRLSGAPVADWNSAAFDAFVAEEKYGHPFRALRVITMMHLAQHDALAAIHPGYGRYALSESAPDADPLAAVSSAAFEVLAASLPAQRPALAARLESAIGGAGDAAARQRGLALGQRAAAAILTRRADDGSDAPAVVPMAALPDGEQPGVYRPIPPATFVYAPGWDKARPFGLQAAEQFRVAPPPALTSAAYAAAFAEVKRQGGQEGSARTPEQTAYAKFWYELSEIGWNRVTRTVAGERKLGLASSARLFALVNVALLDAYIAGWDSKNHYNFWRPMTAIRGAAADDNAATEADAAWSSFEVTPPVPDHPSTHSALGAAAAEVLASVFGDATPFAFTSTSAATPGETRRFQSFSQAAAENADSRVQAGLHFRFACEAGLGLGRQVGAWVVATQLRPQPAR